jgi:hypothetical protein
MQQISAIKSGNRFFVNISNFILLGLKRIYVTFISCSQFQVSTVATGCRQRFWALLHGQLGVSYAVCLHKGNRNHNKLALPVNRQ